MERMKAGFVSFGSVSYPKDNIERRSLKRRMNWRERAWIWFKRPLWEHLRKPRGQ
jgi:hypothetical protein